MLHVMMLEQRVRQRQEERLNEAANRRLLRTAPRQEAGHLATLSRLVVHRSPWHERREDTPKGSRPVSV